jgi:hypothetical protein
METLEQIYEKWSYIDGHGDKGTSHSYIPEYSRLFEPYRDKKLNILEIGVAYGESLEMWSEYFTNAKVYGVDIHDKEIYPYLKDERFKIWISDATKSEFVSELGSLKFDIIIDDGSHYYQDQFDTFNLLKSKVRKGGLYIVEDITDLSITCTFFEKLHKGEVETIDNRKIKGRSDDVLIVYKF